MDRSKRTVSIMEETDAILRGDHFVYVTGEHGDGWIDKDSLFPHTDKAAELGKMLGDAVVEAGLEPDIICGPATGGLIVSQWTSHHMKLPSVFADHAKEEGYHPATAGDGPLRPPFILNRGYDRAVRGKRVLVVDDVLNTGLSVNETVSAVRDCGGEVIGVAVICDRGNATPEDIDCDRLISMATIDVPSWKAEDCRLCAEGVPVNTRYAHGADFVAAQSAKG